MVSFDSQCKMEYFESLESWKISLWFGAPMGAPCWNPCWNPCWRCDMNGNRFPITHGSILFFTSSKDLQYFSRSRKCHFSKENAQISFVFLTEGFWEMESIVFNGIWLKHMGYYGLESLLCCEVLGQNSKVKNFFFFFKSTILYFRVKTHWWIGSRPESMLKV